MKKTLVLLATLLFANVSAWAQSTTIKIGANTFVGYGLLYLAQEKGYFKQQDLTVDLVSTEDKPSTAAAVVRGDLDGWVSTVDTFIFYDAEKLGLKQVLDISQSYGAEGILATKDITDVAQLKGRKIGVEEGSPAYFLLLNALKDAGLKPSDISVVNMKGSDAGAAFIAGQIDVAATWDPWLAQASKRAGGHVLYSTKQKPGLIADTLALRTDFIAQHPQAVTGFINAYFAAYQFWNSHPQESEAIIAKTSGIPLEDVKSGLTLLKFGSPEINKAYFLQDDGIDSVINNGSAIYQQAGAIAKPATADKLVDRSALRTVLK